MLNSPQGIFLINLSQWSEKTRAINEMLATG